ncbi:precorrin-2 dehydrogenase/sirohydrochlorin ferrochelatase family protein [Halanaerobaculum tunisiense]
MTSYPINLNLSGQQVLIVGGGQVANRKLQRLLATSAQIKLVSPQVIPPITEEIDQVEYYQRKFQPQDLTDCLLVIAATDKPQVNSQIGQLANRRDILANIVDNPQLSNFTLPGVVRQGDLLLTVATGGHLPALTKQLKDRLANEFGSEYQEFLDLMAQIRPVVLAIVEQETTRRRIFRKLADRELISLLGEDKPEALARIKELLPRQVGEEISCEL